MSLAPQSSRAMDDHAVVTRIRQGDQDAFRALYENVHAELLRFAFHILGSRDVAEDALQQVFLNIWQHRTEWTPVGSLRAYLFRAVRNHVLNTLRHDKIVASVTALPDPEETYGMSRAPHATDTAIEHHDRTQRLATAMKHLPERQRTATLLYWYKEMSVSETAQIMGVSRQAVEKLLRTAEARLRHLLPADELP